MKSISTYLLFNGNCREAMNFYKQCFGEGILEIMSFADAPPMEGSDNGCMTGAAKDEVMHSSFRNGAITIMGSDWPGHSAQIGDNVQMSIDCDNVAEIERLFDALSQGGKVKQALEDTFWGARFGMLTDKFGIHWMLNCDLK